MLTDEEKRLIFDALRWLIVAELTKQAREGTFAGDPRRMTGQRMVQQLMGATGRFDEDAGTDSHPAS